MAKWSNLLEAVLNKKAPAVTPLVPKLNVGFAGPFWPQFNQVVVALAIGDQAHQLQQLIPQPKHFGVEVDGQEQQIDPFSRAELSARFQIAFKVKMGEFDWLEEGQNPEDAPPLLLNTGRPDRRYTTRR